MSDYAKKIHSHGWYIATIIILFILFFYFFMAYANRLHQIECQEGIGDLSDCVIPPIINRPSPEVFEGHWKCITNGTKIIYDKVLDIRDECKAAGLDTLEKAGCKGFCVMCVIKVDGSNFKFGYLSDCEEYQGSSIEISIIDVDCSAVNEEQNDCGSCIYIKEIPARNETVCAEWGWVK